MQALVLAGGEGTRLRPLTSKVPKPVVQLVDQPFIGYMFEWLHRHGIDDVVMSCGFLADGVRSVLGDGHEYGIQLRYIEEPCPLGTGGALKYAEELLDERFFMLNGDILSDMDLSAQLAQHEATGARATLALMSVEDPSAYGMVHRRPDLSISAFIEKPGLEQKVGRALVNAGAYILEREILETLPEAGTNLSIERDVFPDLVGHGLYGYEASGYWMDIGTPERYLDATFDILQGNITTEIGTKLAACAMRILDGAEVSGRVVAPAVIGPGCKIGKGAIVGGRAVLGRGVSVGKGTRIENSVILDGAVIGAGSMISESIIGLGVQVGENCHVEAQTMLGDNVVIGSDNVLTAGVRIFPDVTLPDGAIRF